MGCARGPFSSTTPTNQVRLPGETFTLTNQYWAFTDFGYPAVQWRKDGKIIPGATNLVQVSGAMYRYQTVFTVTNVQAADAGVYDVVVIGNYWLVIPQIYLSVQLANAQPVFVSPRINGPGFQSELQGVAGRNYAILWSTNLTSWNSLLTLSNITGTVTFSNAPAPEGIRFYRAALLP